MSRDLPVLSAREIPPPTSPASPPPLTATITVDGTQTWPAQVNPTVTPSDGGGAFTYLWTLFAGGIDYTARLSATNVANPTFIPLLGHRYWVAVCTINSADGIPIEEVYTLTLGDSDGWCTPDLTGGTLVDTFNNLTSRTSDSLTIKDTIQPAAQRAYIYWDLAAMLPSSVSTIQVRFIQSAGTYGNDYSLVGMVQVTENLGALDGSPYTIGAGAYCDTLHFARYVLGSTKDGSQQNAAYYGAQASVVMGEGKDQASYFTGCPLDASGNPIGALGHLEVSGVATDYDFPANLYFVASAYSFEVKNGGVDKVVDGVWQIRVAA